MIVQIVDVTRFAILEAKDNAPIGADSYRPEAFQVPFQRVKGESRRFHVSRTGSGVQTRQNPSNAIYIDGRKAPPIVVLIEALQRLAAEAADHAFLYCDNCLLSICEPLCVAPTIVV